MADPARWRSPWRMTAMIAIPVSFFICAGWGGGYDASDGAAILVGGATLAWVAGTDRVIEEAGAIGDWPLAGRAISWQVGGLLAGLALTFFLACWEL